MWLYPALDTTEVTEMKDTIIGSIELTPCWWETWQTGITAQGGKFTTL